MATRRPNPETVEALLDTTWRLADAEAARTDGLDRKLTSLATFASVLISIVALLGGRLLDREGIPGWLAATAVAPILGGVATLLAAVAVAIGSLIPKQSVTLGMEYIRRFPSWTEVTKPPHQVRGNTMLTLIATIARERAANSRKTRRVEAAFLLLLAGLALIAIGGSTLIVWQIVG